MDAIFSQVVALMLMFFGVYQIFTTKKYFTHIKQKGTKQTSKFAALAVYNGFILGFIMIIAGINIIFM